MRELSTVQLMSSSGHDPKRDANALQLKNKLEAAGLVVERRDDPERRGILWNYLQVLEGCQQVFASTDDNWVLTIQDDAYLRDGWDQQLEPALLNAPRPVVYLDHNAGLGWTYRDYAYLEVIRGGWGRLVAYHRDVLVPILATARVLAKDPLYSRWDDVVPVVAGIVHGFTTCMTTQSFAGSIEVRSLIGHPRQKPAEYTLESPITAQPWRAGNMATRGRTPNHDIAKAAVQVAKELGL